MEALTLSAIYPAEPPPGTRAALERLLGRDVEVRAVPPLDNLVAAKNAALRETGASYAVFLDEDRPPGTSFLQLGCRWLDQDPSLDFVTSWESVPPLTDDPTPRVLDRAAILSRPWFAHIPTLLRLSSWQRAGGFDESLEACDDVDLLARLVEKGRGIAVAEAGRALRPWGKQPNWDHPRAYHAALALHRRHAAFLDEHAEELILGKERIIRELVAVRAEAAARYQAVDDEARAAEAELARINAELARHR